MNEQTPNIDTDKVCYSKFGLELFKGQRVLWMLDEKNEPWFKGTDITRILEYKNPRQAVYRNVSPEDTRSLYSFGWFKWFKEQTTFSNLQPKITLINEPALYKLIFRSRMNKAEMFTDWVTREILPSLRRTGQYNLKEEYRLKFEDLNNQLQDFKRDIITKPKNHKKLHTFILIKKNSTCEFPYYVIRCQNSLVNARVKKICKDNPDMKILFRLNRVPNSIHLFNKMKEDLPIKTQRNYFKTDLNEKELLKCIKRLHDDK